MTPLYVAIAGLLAAMVGSLVTWLISRRTKSGKIDTSEAATLWDEGTKMRLELRKEVTSLKSQLSEAITAVTELNQEIKAARLEAERAREETRQSRAETRELLHQIEILHEGQVELHDEVKTHNALTMGALADNQETRRILDVPKEDRTPVEFEHLASVGERQPEGDHPPISPDELREEDIQIEEEPLS